jgi:hypothetical protein
MWYDILFNINIISKKLQSSSMCIDATLRNIEDTMNLFENYRNEGFAYSLNIAMETVKEIGVYPSFRVKCHASRKRQFDEYDCEEIKTRS